MLEILKRWLHNSLVYKFHLYTKGGTLSIEISKTISYNINNILNNEALFNEERNRIKEAFPRVLFKLSLNRMVNYKKINFKDYKFIEKIISDLYEERYNYSIENNALQCSLNNNNEYELIVRKNKLYKIISNDISTGDNITIFIFTAILSSLLGALVQQILDLEVLENILIYILALIISIYVVFTPTIKFIGFISHLALGNFSKTKFQIDLYNYEINIIDKILKNNYDMQQ